MKYTIKSKKGGSNKNWIQKAVNPKHKGYCTPMTKPTCTKKRKALAKTFKSMARKHENGGNILINQICKDLKGGKIVKETPNAIYRKDTRTPKEYKDWYEKSSGRLNSITSTENSKKPFQIKENSKSWSSQRPLRSQARKSIKIVLEDGGNIDKKLNKPKLIPKFSQEKGGKLSADYIKKAHEKPGGSNVGKKKFASGAPRTGPYVGPSGGSPKGSYPIPDIKHAKSALSLSHHAPNPQGIKNAVYRKYPQLKKHENGGTINFDITNILEQWSK